MILHYSIRYQTRHGQALYLQVEPGKKAAALTTQRFPLQYQDEQHWSGTLDTKELGIKKKLRYSCRISFGDGTPDKELVPEKIVRLKNYQQPQLNIYEQISQQEKVPAAFSSKAFEVLFKKNHKKKPGKNAKHPTHIFEVTAPLMTERFRLCLTGSGKSFNDWNKEKPLLLQQGKHAWTIALNLRKDEFPIEYKLGLYDVRQKQIVHFEEGDNRRIEHLEEDAANLYLLDAPFNHYRWKAAGVNIPVSALRTEHSWGIGDFTDLQLLADWASATGMKMIQLLPVNDTTATHSRKDSYPYAAISPFALHPLYLNIHKIATAASFQFTDEVAAEVERLNAATALDYDGVSALKMAAIRELYLLEKHSFKDDFAWMEFFDLNRHWLVPYAAFCCLRDRYETADFESWEELAVYHEDEVQEFAAPDKDHYDEICLHYFIQYHLHLQLKDAVDYAHKKSIVFKGDLPIGVGRYSVDTWMYPHLFHMDMQAGAPPDYYSSKGQNWSFPTYNWDAMAADGYKWWRQRMEHLGNYFDAIRIDHVLGFFRIWSIPVNAVEGTLGFFKPVLALNQDAVRSALGYFDRDRFCFPYVTEDILQDYFGADAAWVKQIFLQDNHFKTEYNTQRKIAGFFTLNPGKKALEDTVLRLFSNVILIEDPQQTDHYNFRINLHSTDSYKALTQEQRDAFDRLYNEYFFSNQNELWEAEGIKKLNALKSTTDMLLCAEDLGMVPDFMEAVLQELEILSLQVQRMPKLASDNFSHPKNAPYASVVTPSTHDMSTIREWWQEERQHIQYFFNNVLEHDGIAPQYCASWVSRDIIEQHLCSPAMWAVFLLQDLLGIDENIRSGNIHAERINDPSNGDHEWNYRMHTDLEKLIEDAAFTKTLKELITHCGR
ncbi:MAG: 4-alpha-glucanotransferase [Ferruginibacter sp.]|nr:4-alpha-glucanotransferase [Ferruginibacter sp.]